MLKRACPREEVNALLRSAMGNERTGALARIKVRRFNYEVLKKLTDLLSHTRYWSQCAGMRGIWLFRSIASMDLGRGSRRLHSREWLNDRVLMHGACWHQPRVSAL
jgi:hypothetical protein